jgi:hypothetical protein
MIPRYLEKITTEASAKKHKHSHTYKTDNRKEPESLKISRSDENGC